MAQRVRGTGVSDGIAFAKAHILERERIAIPHRIIAASQINEETERFRDALENAKKGLRQIKENLIAAESREPAFIIDAHLMMLDDELLVEGTMELISKDRINAD